MIEMNEAKLSLNHNLRWLKIKGHQRMLSVFLYHLVLLYSFKTGPCIQLKVWLLFRLVGQQSTCIYLPLSPNSRGTAISNHAWLLISVLEILTEVLVLTYQVFSPLSYHPILRLCKLFYTIINVPCFSYAVKSHCLY